MTEKEVSALMEELTGTLKALGIPVSSKILPAVLINSRAKRRLGCCYAKAGIFEIEVSASLLEKPEQLRATLAHELLHTCPGCRNHGERWKAYAQRVNKALGMDIRRLAPMEEVPGGEGEGPLRRDTVKYVLECRSCGAKIYRSRLSKAVKQPWRYRCKCGGRLKRIL